MDGQDILNFVNTGSGKRMKQAAGNGLLWKEQPFVLGIPMEDVYPEMKEEGQETVLVQGIIDVYFEEPEGLTVLDYKTDRVQTGEELKEKYGRRLFIRLRWGRKFPGLNKRE